MAWPRNKWSDMTDPRQREGRLAQSESRRVEPEAVRRGDLTESGAAGPVEHCHQPGPPESSSRDKGPHAHCLVGK